MATMVADKLITLGDRQFSLYMPYDDIARSIAGLSKSICEDYRGKPAPLFLGILNGSFMFFAELVKGLDFPCEVSFVKLASYAGDHSTGEVSELIGLSTPIEGRDVIVVEDIVETGGSLEHLVNTLKAHRPASVEVATLFFKPARYSKNIGLKYKGFSIPDDFIIGFGMDYNQMGRNLCDIYKVVDEG